MTFLELAEADIDLLVSTTAASYENTLKQTPEFSDFDNWPADAQFAISMGRALGPGFGTLAATRTESVS